MKKFTLIAVAALTAASASAQYTCDPTVETVLAKGKVSQVMPIALDEGAVAKFEAQGANVTSAAPKTVTKTCKVTGGRLRIVHCGYSGLVRRRL